MMFGNGALVPVEVGVSLLVWSVLVLYISGTLMWALEMLFLWPRYEMPTETIDLADVQVRIVTIDAESVVQRTVESLPSAVTDRHVIAESPIDVAGSAVHVVPDEFECEATRKGRALEWARRNIDCDREYVLYLDEDSLVTNLDGMPVGDIVQLRELPYRTGSLLTYLSEIFRLGFQLEQRAFTQLKVPLYAWGGGLVVRKELEDKVTWNFDTIIEDTVFAWRAALDYDADFELAEATCRNQSPPTITEMIKQRRRWLAGSKQELGILPLHYRLAFALRNVTWGLSPLIPLLPFITFLFPGLILYEAGYLAASLVLFVVPVTWSVLGYLYYQESVPIGIMTVVLTPVLTIVHSLGGLFGLLSAPIAFDSTRKVEEEAYLPSIDGDTVLDSPGSVSDSLRIDLDRGSPAVWLSGIVALGAGLRLYGLTGASLWVDEIYSVTYRSSLPFTELVTASEAHPPLYYTSLKYWMGLFGNSILSTRMLSALIGVAAVVAIYYLGRELFGTNAGLVASLLLALSTFHIHTSQTVRMYGLLSLLTIVSTYYLVRLMHSEGHGSTVPYIATTWLLLLSHLFGALVVLAHNVYFIGIVTRDYLNARDADTSLGRWVQSKISSRLRTDGGRAAVEDSPIGAEWGSRLSRPTLGRWTIVQGIVGALYLGFFLQILPRLLLADSGNSGSNVQWIQNPDFQTLWRTFAAFAGQPLQYPILAYGSRLHLLAVVALGAAAIAIAALFVTWRWEGSSPNIRRRLPPNAGVAVALLVVCLGVPIVFSYLITPMYVIRYAAPASVGFVLLVAGGVASIRNRGLQVAILGVLVVSSAAFAGVYHTTDTREDWGGAVQYVNGNIEPDDLVVMTPGWNAIESSLTYHGLSEDVTTVKYPTESERFESVKTEHDTVWVIRREPQSVEPIRTGLQETHSQTETRQFGDIVVYRFDRD